MIRRYDLRRSDNYPSTNRVMAVVSGDGTLSVYTGFPVTSATVSFVDDQNVDRATYTKMYVSSYTSTGFVVTYEDVPAAVGFIDFTYFAV